MTGSYTMEQLQAAYKKAEAQNLPESMKELQGMMEAQSDHAYKQEEFSDSEAFGAGVGNSLTEVGSGLGDLALRATSSVLPDNEYVGEDALDRYVSEAERRRERFEGKYGESGYATAGSLVGHIAPALAGGLAFQAASKGRLAYEGASRLIQGARTGGALAAEGAIYDAATTSGGAVERLKAGAIGGVMNVGGGAVTDLAGAAYRKGKLWSQGKSIKESGGRTPEGLEAQAEAKRNGFELDAVDAEASVPGSTVGGFSAKANVQRNEIPEYNDFVTTQQADMGNRARSFLPEDLRGTNTAQINEELANTTADVLSEGQKARQKAVSAQYKVATDLLDGKTISVGSLGDDIRTIADDFDIDDDEIQAKVYTLLKRNAEGLENGYLSGAATLKLRRELTSLQKKGGPSAVSLRQIKELLDAAVVKGAEKAGNPAMAAAQKKAVSMARENAKDYASDGPLVKVTKKEKGDSTVYAKPPVKTVNANFHSKKPEDIARMRKAAKAQGPEAEAAFEASTNIPLIEALEKSIGNNSNAIEFNPNQLEDAMRNIGEASRVELLGADKAKEIDAFIRSAKLVGTTNIRKGLDNNSKTGHNVGRIASLLGMDGGLGIIAETWANATGRSARLAAKDARLLIAGKLPKGTANRSMAKMREALYKENPNLIGHDKLANMIIRRSLSETYQEKD